MIPMSDLLLTSLAVPSWVCSCICWSSLLNHLTDGVSFRLHCVARVVIFNFRSKYTDGVASTKKWCTYAVTMWPFQTVWTYVIPKWSQIMEAAWEQGQVYTYVPPSMHCISFAVRLSIKWESGQTLYYSASLVHPVGNQKVEGEILHKGLC